MPRRYREPCGERPHGGRGGPGAWGSPGTRPAAGHYPWLDDPTARRRVTAGLFAS
ncbi:hypothetical protein ACFRMQ_03410 [Kitasatospora sp. NPDC056783]|uniref:hypothetical protein n=1 Tax=Kitasatospora sp. NPDC056783 TaxID=3345943 RepID=UPI003685D068